MHGTHYFQCISNVFDNTFMLLNKNGSTNTSAMLTKKEKSWVHFVVKPNGK